MTLACSALALADDLRRFLNGQPVTARRIGPLQRGWKGIRRHPQGSSGSFQVDVNLVPAMLHPGELRGTIRIHTSDPTFPEFVVPVSASIR